MNKLLFICCCLFMLALGMLLTTPVAAQDAPAEQEIERKKKLRVGVYFSRTGLLAAGYTVFAHSGFHGSDPPSQDLAPYPFHYFSIRYNKYQVIWGSGADRNEHIRKFAGRYNYYPLKKVVYVFGGPVILHFHKKFSLTKQRCSDGTLPGDYGCDGETISIEIKTDRPDNKSIIFGINAGFGIEYILLFDTIVISHEIEFYQLTCKFKGITCKGSDFKFLGIHLKI